MARYTHRVHTTLTEEQFATLSRVVEETQKPLSVLIRKAIEAVYFTPRSHHQRLVALENLLSLNAPVADWQEMEEEIVQGAAT